MTLADVKTYLSSRIQTDDFLANSDAFLTKYMNTANMLLGTYYYIEQIKEESDLVKVVGEEMIFLYNADIDLNLFYRYEGLTSFGIGMNAIKGDVDYSNKGDLFSPIVKAILESLGIEEKIEDINRKVKERYTCR